MLIYEHPGDWQVYLNKKENVGKPIMEVRKKYLLEENAFLSNINNTNFNTVNSTTVASAASAGTGDNFPQVIFIGSKEDGGFAFKRMLGGRKKSVSFGIPKYERVSYTIPNVIYKDTDQKVRIVEEINEPSLVRKRVAVNQQEVKIEEERVVKEVGGKKLAVQATLEWNDPLKNWVYTENAIVFKVVPQSKGRFAISKSNPFGVANFIGISDPIVYNDIIISDEPFSGKDLGDIAREQQFKQVVDRKEMTKSIR